MLNPWLFISRYLESVRDRRECAHTAIDDGDPVSVEVADSTPDTYRPRFDSVGAWCGIASLANPERDVAFAKRIGLNNLEIIVNDHSADRKPRAFDVRPIERITKLADECRANGIAPTLMTWVMPHEKYLQGMGAMLVRLCMLTGAKRVMVDAEEPLTLAVNARGRRLSKSDYRQAGAWFEEYVVKPLHEVGVEVWVTGIRYTPTHKLFPLLRRLSKTATAQDELLRVADGGCPQCYSTSTSKAAPFTVIAKGVATWQKKFGRDLRFIIAGAAYRQRGIKGHTVRSALTAFFDSADDFFETHEGPRRVLLWGLNSIRKDPRIADVVKSIALDGLADFDSIPTPQSDAPTPVEGVGV